MIPKPDTQSGATTTTSGGCHSTGERLTHCLDQPFIERTLVRRSPVSVGGKLVRAVNALVVLTGIPTLALCRHFRGIEPCAGSLLWDFIARVFWVDERGILSVCKPPTSNKKW